MNEMITPYPDATLIPIFDKLIPVFIALSLLLSAVLLLVFALSYLARREGFRSEIKRKEKQ